MILIIVIFGQDAVKYHEWTGQVPLDKFLSLNGGVVSEVKFNTQEEYSAYLQALADYDSWPSYATIEKEIVIEKCPHCEDWESFFADRDSKVYCPDCGSLIIPAKQRNDKIAPVKLQFQTTGNTEWRNFPEVPTVENYTTDFPSEFMHGYHSSDYVAWEDDMRRFVDGEITLEEFKEYGHEFNTQWQAEEEMKWLRQIILNETMEDFFVDFVAVKIKFRQVQTTL